MSVNTNRESLYRLVTTIDADLGVVTDNEEGSSIVRVLDSGEIAVRSLDGEHPMSALVGFVTPEDWAVFGVIAYGLGVIGKLPSLTPPTERRRLRVVHICDRQGVQASVVRFAYDEQPVSPPDDTPPVGQVADALLRTMNLPTPPPDAGSAKRWDEVRWSVAAGERYAPHMTGSVAAWMDAGMFARDTLSKVDTFKPGQMIDLLGRDLMTEIVTDLDKD